MASSPLSDGSSLSSFDLFQADAGEVRRTEDRLAHLVSLNSVKNSDGDDLVFKMSSIIMVSVNRDGLHCRVHNRLRFGDHASLRGGGILILAVPMMT